ncbi:MAG: hypothetical protein ACD_45C00637G0003, partial [uncultured bacterium]
MASHTKQNRIKRHACIGLISLFNMSFMPILSFASPSVHDLLDYGPPENMSGPMAATATFQQKANTSGGTDASSVSKVTLRYFTSTDCSGSTAGTYNTPDGTSYSINTSTTFGLNSVSTYGVGNTQLSLNMSTINSVAIFLKSTNNNTPQADFTGSCGTNPSFCCVRIDCSSGTECTQVGGIGTQNFQLKTTAAIGDPADGGVIGCMNGELNNLVVPAADNSTGTKQWGGYGTTTNATSTTDGATNTSTIVAALGAGTTYAAGICNAYTTTGGFTTGWFLPAGNNSGASGQLNCLYTNKA